MRATLKELEKFEPSEYSTTEDFIKEISGNENIKMGHIEIWYEWKIKKLNGDFRFSLADVLVKTLREREEKIKAEELYLPPIETILKKFDLFEYKTTEELSDAILKGENITEKDILNWYQLNEERFVGEELEEFKERTKWLFVVLKEIRNK
ncbi:MAG: hypothetical protein DWQ06_13750 [Calditrichaeota bacterium]|nr:MAG: hypothetical protein DWQ06_13750 [Calditrichota bacterium]